VINRTGNPKLDPQLRKIGELLQAASYQLLMRAQRALRANTLGESRFHGAEFGHARKYAQTALLMRCNRAHE
jgi:hypothetical protein